MEFKEQNYNSLTDITKTGDEFDSLLISNINKFYKLKKEYEETILKKKNSLLNNLNLSRKERKQLYNNFIPKCIACGCDGGTKFRSYKNENQSRILEAYCKCSNKCNFKINLNLGSYSVIGNSITKINEELNVAKKKIILHKNNILFGVIKENSSLFQVLVSNLDNLNSEYTDYFEYNTMFNDNTVSEENVTLSEKELVRVINTFDDSIMSNSLLRLLHNVLSNNLFIDGSITFVNYFVCVYFIKGINKEINKIKELDNYDELMKGKNTLQYKKKNTLLRVRELFNRIIKYKYGKFSFKKDINTNSVSFINNFSNNTEINEAEETKINEFVIDVKKVNVNLKTNKKSKKNLTETNKNENIEININDENIENNINDENIENNINDENIEINIDDENIENNIDDENNINDENNSDEDDDYYKKDPIKIGEQVELEKIEELN